MSTSPEPGTPEPGPAANAPAPSAPESVPSKPLTLEQLVPTARALVFGLAWGALMLIVLGFWMSSKNEAGTRILNTVLLLAASFSAALATWQAITLWFKQETPADKARTLAQQRRIFGNVLLVAGLAIIALAFYLGIGKKPDGSTGFIFDNLAESIGVVIFGIIALASGFVLTLPPQADESSMRSLVGMTPMLKLLQLIIGVVAIAGFCVIAYQTHTGAYLGWIPELAALLFLSILCFACVIWLNTGEPDETGMRVFVLVFGGSLGLILFLYTVARAYLWRQDIFLGGIPSWQGANAWRFWLVAYLQIVALILMFVSFRFARTDIRSNVTLRRVMYGYDAILQGLLLVEVLAVVNVVIYALVPFTYDWTATRGAYALSDSSRNLIARLKKEMNVVVLMRQGDPIYKDLHNLLDNCSALNGAKFKVTYFSPEVNRQKFQQLSKTFPKISPEPGAFAAGVLLVNGPIPENEDHNVPYSFVAEDKISETKRRRGPGDKGEVIFKGEAEIMKEVKFLVQDKKKHKVYVLQGDEEPDINNTDNRDRFDMRETFSSVGLGILVQRLQLDNYDISGLNFGKDLGLNVPNVVYAKEDGPGKKKSVPEDCRTLIVAGASRKLSQDALDAIEAYMDRGGKMLVFFDVLVDPKDSKLRTSGMETLVKRFGVDVGDDFVLRFPRGVGDDVRDLFAFPARKTDNPLAREFSKPILVRGSARVVRPAPAPGRYRADTILQFDLVPGQFVYMIEKKASVLSNPQKYMEELHQDKGKFVAALSKEPIPFAAAVSETGPNGDKPAMVVFGDTEFITNRDMARFDTNYAFVVSSIEWMAERESIGAQPKVKLQFAFGPDVNLPRMIFLPGWIMLLCLVSLGIAVWMVRRR